MKNALEYSSDTLFGWITFLLFKYFVIQQPVLKFAHNLLTLYRKNIKFLRYIKIDMSVKVLYIKDFKNLKNITKSLINFKSCHPDHIKSPCYKGFFDFYFFMKLINIWILISSSKVFHACNFIHLI